MHKDDLLELVFKDVSGDTARQLVMALFAKSVQLPARVNDPPYYERGGKLSFGSGLRIDNVQTCILAHDGVYDVEVNFVRGDVVGPLDAVIREVHALAIRLARELDVLSFYAGLEPASDEDTRFFSGSTRGPL